MCVVVRRINTPVHKTTFIQLFSQRLRRKGLQKAGKE